MAHQSGGRCVACFDLSLFAKIAITLLENVQKNLSISFIGLVSGRNVFFLSIQHNFRLAGN